MSIMELFYVTRRQIGEDAALQMVLLARSLPVTELPLADDLILPAGDLKARYQISVADAWIAATAGRDGLTLVHKDPEFEPLKEELDVQELPYKSRRA
jgi:predicted nucleic acid-binding protein